MNLRRRMHGEDGTALLLTLAFISLLGLFTVAILSATYSDFKTTSVVRTRTDALYSADGAADFALEQVQGTANTSCPTTATALATQPPAINGASTNVTYTCSGGSTTTTSTNAFTGTYSVVATGQYGIYTAGSSQAGNNLNAVFNGDQFSENRDNLDVGTAGDGNKLVFKGNLAIGGSPCAWNATTEPEVDGSCLANQSPAAITTPTVVVPTASALPIQTGTSGNANCRILYPGKYGSGGLALPAWDGTKGYYLASGTYYLNDLDSVTLTGYIQGGGQQTATSPSTVTNPLMTTFRSRCPAAYANDANAKTLNSGYTYTGSGVTIILGGNSQLRFAEGANTQVELFPRVASSGPDSAATDTVSIWGHYTTAGATVPANYNVSNVYDNYWTQYDHLADVVVHGYVYQPDAKLYVSPLNNTDAGGIAQLEGGAYLAKLDLFSDNNTGVAPITGKPATTTAAPRTVTFTITTQLPGGGGATVITVVATYPTNGGPPTVTSWRKA